MKRFIIEGFPGPPSSSSSSGSSSSGTHAHDGEGGSGGVGSHGGATLDVWVCKGAGGERVAKILDLLRQDLLQAALISSSVVCSIRIPTVDHTLYLFFYCNLENI